MTDEIYDLTGAAKYLGISNVQLRTHNLRKRERMTKNEMEIVEKLHSLHVGCNSPEEGTSLHLDKEVLAMKSYKPKLS